MEKYPRSFASKFLPTAFTLVELIIVIIIVGILAAVGINQYSLTVEKGRTAEAKIGIGTMRQLAYEYYLNNGTVTGMTNDDVGVDNTCVSTNFYRYQVAPASASSVFLIAHRCTSGGKIPNASTWSFLYVEYFPASGECNWYCKVMDGTSSGCFGLLAWPSGSCCGPY